VKYEKADIFSEILMEMENIETKEALNGG